MPFAASLSRDRSLEKAIESACQGISEQLSGAAPDLTVVFVSPHHVESSDGLAAKIRQKLGSGTLIGCSGETVIGGSEEVEDAPALSLWSAILPHATLEPFQVEFRRTPDGIASTGYPEPPDNTSDVRLILFLGEPFTTPPDSVIERMGEDYPGVPIVGGMASSTRHPGSNRLFLNDSVFRKGGAGVVVHGGPRVRSIVSQGCRPIGTTGVITKAEENIVLGLGGVPPLKRFAELFATLSEHDQELAKNGLHLGLAMDEYKDTFGRGDFLISNVIGADSEKGALAVGNYVRVGQTAQFHIRDAASAHEDLVEMLKADKERNAAPPQAAILFSCNGRGSKLFASPSHDARTIRESTGDIPLAGFFAQGEFGPDGGRNHIHGFTASIALFE